MLAVAANAVFWWGSEGQEQLCPRLLSLLQDSFSCWVALFSFDVKDFAFSYCILFCQVWLLSLKVLVFF